MPLPENLAATSRIAAAQTHQIPIGGFSWRGKPLGILGATWLMLKVGWCRLPPGVTWDAVMLVGLLAGIGFTMSIFIAMLAFNDERLLSAAKLGVLLGSLLAATIGTVWSALFTGDCDAS